MPHVAHAASLLLPPPPLPEVATKGRVLVLDKEGQVEAQLAVPGPEITDLSLSKGGEWLLVAEASTGSVYRLRTA